MGNSSEIREIIGFNDANSGVVGIDSNTYNNGQHIIKAVTVDYSGLVTVSDKVEVNFANNLYCVSGSDSFEQGKNYQIAAMNSDGTNVRVQLIDWSGNVAYTSAAKSDVNESIPADRFTEQIYDLQIQKESILWDTMWENSIGQKYNPATARFPHFAIFLPTCTFGSPAYPGDYRKRTVQEIILACIVKGKTPVLLSKNECNWDNFSSLLKQPSLKYVYIATHANFDSFEITGGKVYADRSHGGPPESPSVHYLAYLNLGEKLKIVHVDTCIIIVNNDMTRAWLGIYNPTDPPPDRVLFGWQSLIPFKPKCFDMFGANIWFSMAFRETGFQEAVGWALEQDHSWWFYHNYLTTAFAFKGDGDNTVTFP